MKMQYQIEKEEVIKNGGDLEQFQKDWDKRKYAAYRKHVKTEADVHAFRCGKFKI